MTDPPEWNVCREWGMPRVQAAGVCALWKDAAYSDHVWSILATKQGASVARALRFAIRSPHVVNITT